MLPLELNPFQPCRFSFLCRNGPSFAQNAMNHSMRDYAVRLPGDTPGENTRPGREIRRYTRTRYTTSHGSGRGRRSGTGEPAESHAPGCIKGLDTLVPGCNVSHGDGRETPAAMIRRDNIPGIICRHLLRGPGLTGYWEIMRSCIEKSLETRFRICHPGYNERGLMLSRRPRYLVHGIEPDNDFWAEYPCKRLGGRSRVR